MKKKYQYNDKVVIPESDMNFGPFEKSRVWRIEKNQFVSSLGIKIAEFIHVQASRNTQIIIVEAKSSSPKQENSDRFQDFISDITEKMTNTFNIYMAILQNRHTTIKKILPAKLKDINVAKADVKLVLVINGHEKSWLVPIHDALRKSLQSLTKTWALGPTAVKVVNQDGARIFNLIRF